MHSADSGLVDALSAALPRGHCFKYHHVSTPPTSCPALYAPPPGNKPERTTCESHLLNVSVSPGKSFKEDTVAIFAIEVYIYSTRRLTTLFVSKADSTGWISLLDLPKGFPSIVKTLSSTFISYLIRSRHRPDRRLVLSLFARAQSQYLYPGSDENSKKHILDDRQLVKWWCRTLDPILREYEGEDTTIPEEQEFLAKEADTALGHGSTSSKVRAKSYLIVPGHDRYETTAFFPPSARSDPPASKRWYAGHPLREIASLPNAPPRCLVPHFPDDPKSRFLLDLDEEIQDAPPPSRSHASSQQSGASSQTANAQLSNPQESPSKRGKGQWKSVKTLEQFWEMMAFRQECSSGRLVGFLWLVFTPDSLEEHDDALAPNASVPPGSLHAADAPILQPTPSTVTGLATRPARKPFGYSMNPATIPVQKNPSDTPKRRKLPAARKPKPKLTSKPRLKRSKGRLTGPIVARAPRIKQAPSTQADEIATTTHPAEPGTLVLAPKAYARVHEVLVRLDFATVAVARASTAKWVRETGIVAGRAAGAADWGVVVEGRAAPVQGSAVARPDAAGGDGAVNVMIGVKRKVKDVAPSTKSGDGDGVNVLGVGMVRKKVKVEPDEAGGNGTRAVQDGQQIVGDGVHVNALSGGLVRKKVKT